MNHSQKQGQHRLVLGITVILTLWAVSGVGPSNTAADSAAEPMSGNPGLDFPVDHVLKTIREQSVFRQEVDWPTVEADVRVKVNAAATDADKAKAVVHLFAKMNDVHSILTIRGQSYSHYEGVDEATRKKLLPLLDRERAQHGKVIAKLLEERIGYVLVPTISANTTEQIGKYSRELHEAVVQVARQQPTGWIVDLRLNGGGNLYPMLVGLRHLLGDGVVGGTIDAHGRRVQEWVLKRDGLYWREGTADRRFVEFDMSAQAPEPSAPVVVLVGPITRSSGQATALAFRGRPNCRTLGEPTAKGYTTVTTPIVINADVSLSLAVGFMADRSGTPCKVQVLPDEKVEEGDVFDALKEDKKIRAAITWLSRKANE